MIFVDTNYFLRFLVRDVEDQYQEVRQLFERGITKEKKLFTSLIVLFEIYWVLSSFYKQDKREIAKILAEILKMKFISINERDLLLKALEVYKTGNLGLEDSYNLVFSKAKKASAFASFDKILVKKFRQGTTGHNLP